MRTFIAIEIPVHIRDSIDTQVQAFKTMKMPIKWVGHENLHITLKFLGEIHDDKRSKLSFHLKAIAARQKVFSATLKNFGCFPHARRPRVLWIGVDKGAEHLITLTQDIEESLTQCGFPRENRFHPHLTIGRTKKPCIVDDIIKKEFSSEPFNVDTLVMFKSTLTPQGAVYEALDTFRFEETRGAISQETRSES